MNGARLYGRYVGASIRAQMQYPVSFLMLAVGQFTISFVEFVGLWSLFRRFGQVDGWTIGQIAIFYGVVNISFAIADAATRGFDVFGTDFVKTGTFDRILLRPRATTLQLLGYELRVNRVGRLLQGLLVLAIGASLTAIDWDVSKFFLLLATVAGGVALFVGILVLQATLAFWTVESLEVANILTYGGVEAAEYPLDIYSRYFRDFLIFVVPIGCVSYFPVERLLGHADRMGAPNWMLVASPIVGFIFLAVSLGVWRFGVRHYTSTGS
jgi:viologen exporter family transport system permease protein